MNELTLNVKQNPGVIELNFDEIEKALDAKLAEYKGAVFTEESKSIAKSEVANLRKLKKDFEDARKGVKKEWMKPYEDFEAKMKNLTEKIDEPICLIDSQLKDFERKRREERREKIKEIYQEIIGDMEEYCDLGRIYDTKMGECHYNHEIYQGEHSYCCRECQNCSKHYFRDAVRCCGKSA